MITEQLSPSEWAQRQAAHEARLGPVVKAHLARRKAGRKHPVVDFLFEYYGFRPSRLMKWTPGVGVLLKDGAEHFSDRRHFRAIGSDALVEPGGLRPDRQAATRWILRLLEQTRDRPPMLGCHGLHEWAMVYRDGEVRHERTPLRVSRERIREVVDAGPLVCTHYDAFRFFAPSARPLNHRLLEAGSQHASEQPGCLHANMDLYRWAMKRWPLIPSSLVAEAFLLALEIREVDMRASPYDLSGLGFTPIAIETAEGRDEYRCHQQRFYERARPLRERLIGAYRRLLAAMPSGEEAGTTVCL